MSEEITKTKQLQREERQKKRESTFGKMITHMVKRENGSIRVVYDFQNCISRTDPTGARDTDLNYLMERYQPDQLAMYIAARNQHRPEIKGHDFTREPDLQTAKNEVYRLKSEFEKLPEEIKNRFGTVDKFLKFIDNPANAEKLVELKLLTKKQIQKLEPEPMPTPTPTPTPT